MVDFVHHWRERGFAKVWLVKLLGIGTSKFYSWQERYGKANDHNGKIPRDYWVQDWEKEKIIEFYLLRRELSFPISCLLQLQTSDSILNSQLIVRISQKRDKIFDWVCHWRTIDKLVSPCENIGLNTSNIITLLQNHTTIFKMMRSFCFRTSF